MSVSFPIDLGTFPLYRGDAAGRNKVTITLKDSQDALVDLTVFGDTWTAQAREFIESTEAIELTVDDTNAADGVLEVSIPDDDSAALPWALVFDVQATGGTVDPITVFKGAFATDGEVTR